MTLSGRRKIIRRAIHWVGVAAKGAGFWIGLALVLLFIAGRMPGALKWLPYLLAFLAGVAGLFLFARRLDTLLDKLLAIVKELDHRIVTHLHPQAHFWKILIGIAGALILGVAIWKAWPSWQFLATSSLREDEILNIEQYTSRGFAKAVDSYSLARNHIFYNVVSSLIPGNGSTWPLRARLVSFLAVSAGLALLVLYSARRGWFLFGALAAGFVAGNHFAMKTLLEARGYGLIFFFSILTAVSFAEWARTGSRKWLSALAVATVLGSYTLPYFVVFGAVFLLLAWISKPSKTTFGTGLLVVLSLTLLYLPVAADVLRVATGYSEEYAGRSLSTFASLENVRGIFQFFMPYPLLTISPAGVVLLLSAAMAFVCAGKCIPSWQRLTAGVLASGLLAVVGFFLVIESVPLRTAAFLGGPLALLFVLIIGGLFRAPFFHSIRPVAELLFAVAAVFILWASSPGEELLPRQDWRTVAKFLERAFPSETPVWTFKSYARMIKWNRADRAMPEFGPLDSAAVAEGRLVALDAEFNDWAENRRITRKDLPADVRFVTFPLLLNYHRAYFVPPAPVGILSVTANEQGIVVPVPGVQVPDPALLSKSGGHGDTLMKVAPVAPESVATPQQFSLPTSFVLKLEKPMSGGSCNFLFSHSLQDHEISCSVEDIKGNWMIIRDVLLVGEFLSLGIPDRDIRSIQVEIKGQGQIGLLATWLRPEDVP